MKTVVQSVSLTVTSLLAFSIGATAAAQAVDVTGVGPNKGEAVATLPSGQGADLTISFEAASGLTGEALGISVAAIEPFDPRILSRLPASSPGSITPAGGLPLLITVAPDEGFSFDGLAEVELYTKDLHFTAGSPLRMFKAEDGGAFRDITTLNAGGSYRSRGSTGKFSEFVIVSDLRAPAIVLAEKAARLDALIADARDAGGDALAGSLAGDLAAARAAAADGRYDDAVEAADALADRAEAAGTDGTLPNTYAPDGPENLAGQLRAEALTLRFTLTLAANGF